MTKSKPRRTIESEEESHSNSRKTVESVRELVESKRARVKKEGRKESPSKSGPQRGPIVGERGSIDKVSTDSTMAIANSLRTKQEPTERFGVVNAKQAAAIQRWRRAGIPPETIGENFGLAPSTIYKICKGILPEPGFEQPLQSSPSAITPVTPEPALHGNGGELPPQSPNQAPQLGQYRQPQNPRLQSEIFGERPQVFEADDAPNPVLPSMNLGNQQWDQLHLLLAGSAMQAGFDDVLEYFRAVVLVDLRSVDLLKAAIPHSDTESLRRNLMTIVRKANTFDRLYHGALGEAERELGKKTGGGS